MEFSRVRALRAREQTSRPAQSDLSGFRDPAPAFRFPVSRFEAQRIPKTPALWRLWSHAVNVVGFQNHNAFGASFVNPLKRVSARQES